MGSARTEPAVGAVRVDPRCERSRHSALAAAVELLREDGLPGLTFEAVAARSGVAKTTLYRHFADRAALHLAAIESVGPVAVMSVTGDLRADLIDFLSGLEHTLHHSDFGAVLPTAIDGAERSEQMADLARAAASQRREYLTERLRVARDDGTLPDGVDPDVLCSLLVGPIFYRRLLSRQPYEAGFVPALVDQVLHVQPEPSPGT